MKKVIISVPYKNEAENLKALVPMLTTRIKKLNLIYSKSIDVSLVFIDDHSSDDSHIVVDTKIQDIPYASNIKSNGHGQRGAFATILESFSGDYFLRMDSDLQDHPDDLELFFQKIVSNHDVIIGLREVRKHRRILRILTGVFDLVCIALFASPFHSSSGSFAAYKWELLSWFPLSNNDHRYLALIALMKGVNNPAEVLVRHGRRKNGVSNYRLSKKILLGPIETLWFFIRLIYVFYKQKSK